LTWVRQLSCGTIIGLAIVLSFSLPLLAQQGTAPSFTERLRNRIEASTDRPDEWILATRALPAFYEDRAYRPVWVSEIGVESPAQELVAFITSVSSQGLEPGHYHLSRLRELAS
jgi:hypothetical protein